MTDTLIWTLVIGINICAILYIIGVRTFKKEVVKYQQAKQELEKIISEYKSTRDN